MGAPGATRAATGGARARAEGPGDGVDADGAIRLRPPFVSRPGQQGRTSAFEKEYVVLVKSTMTALAALLLTAACGSPEKAVESPPTAEAAAPAEQTVMVGGAAMSPSRNIVENASTSADHTTLVAAVKAAGLVETLSGAGPFTVFAPTNAAFAKLPAGTVDTLLAPANKGKLTAVLTYHVVAGRYSAADVLAAIDAGGGKAELTTVQGGKITATRTAAGVSITDANGGVSNVTIADVNQSNGVIHVVDTVILPKA
jgi:uncharacterized surface protein with fasciclin (FAS1) repeats